MSGSFPRIQAGRPALVLAPMEGVTDAPMRALLTERGGFSFCVSEFLRVSQVAPPAHIFLRHVPELVAGARTPAGVPVQVQLLGGDPGRLAEAARTAVACGARAVDLNFGCPAPTVNRHDGGATLLRYPDRIRSIVAAVRAALPAEIPVSAKLRLGWDDPGAIHLNAERAAEGGAAWLTIHARTRLQGYNPPVFWRPIGEVRRRLGLPVVANGDIWTLDDFRRCREETGAEHFMIGRSALADPSLPLAIARELGIGAPAAEAEAEAGVDWPDLLARFAEIAEGFVERPLYVPCRIKQWARMAHQRRPLPWYEGVKRAESTAEILRRVGPA
jgi:tRNA-dihydrouridine synthase C